MKVGELLFERLSSIVYHYTPIFPAKTILSTGKFELSSSLGSIEHQYQPKGYPYFLSTTRTRRGGYHTNVLGNSGVLFVLDGDWYNRHYKSAPIDYWQERGKLLPGRSSEAEDRIFSKDPSMSIGGVKQVHVYVNPEKVTDTVKAKARQVLILSKRLDIPAYFYTDPQAWVNFDKRNIGDIKVLTGQEHMGGYLSTHKGWLSPWIELLYAKTKDQLGEKADKLRYSLSYANDYSINQSAQGLGTDMSNARKPGSGPDRENAVKIINFMRQNKLDSLVDFVTFLKNKWSSKQK